VLIFLFTALLAIPWAQDYTVNDLGGAAPNLDTWPGALNDRGQVAGAMEIPAPPGFTAYHAFFYDGQQLIDIPPIVPNLAFGYAINIQGHVFGQSSAQAQNIHAFHWDGTQTHDVHVGNRNFSTVKAVNAAGMEIGIYSIQNPVGIVDQRRAFFRYQGNWQDLGTFGGEESQASGINDFGDVVGFARTPAGKLHAFLWQGGSLMDLGHLGDNYSNAFAINRSKQIVGLSRTPAGLYVGFLWQNGNMVQLPSLGGGTSDARGINDFGSIVGNAALANGLQRAVLWQNGVAIDLNTRIPANGGITLTSAGDINELGEIMATGLDAADVKRAFLLSPILDQPSLSPILPGIAGHENYLTGRGFTPLGRLAVVYGFSTGSYPVPGCPGLYLDISQPTLGRMAHANPAGRLFEIFQVPATLRGRVVYVQVIDIALCKVSLLVGQDLR
jgi:probable HAF family extracellular repeat protein